MESPVRLNKFIADRGFASRREADKLIADGRVFVNGAPAVLGQKVTAKDRVEISDLGAKKLRYVVYYKPTGTVTMAATKGADDAGTALAHDHRITGLFPVGRLDKGAEGLLLFTNDGRVTTRIIGGGKDAVQEYDVTTLAPVTPSFLTQLEKRLRKHDTGARVSSVSGKSHAFNAHLTRAGGVNLEGTCTDLGHHLTSLVRTQLGTLKLGDLEPGEMYELNTKESVQFRRSIGLR